MRALRRFLNRLAATAMRRQTEERLREEFEEHLALQTAENLRAGLSPVEARRQAVLKFGAVESLKEEYRDRRGLPFLETLMQDTRHALRRLRKSPAFTITTVLTLALGIGATTSIFTLVHAVILKSLAVAKPGELYRLGKESRCCYYGGYSQENEFSIVSYDLYKYFRNNTKGFAELAAFSASTELYGVRRAGRPEAAQVCPGEFVSGNYFAMFGIGPYAGRLLAPNDDLPAPADTLTDNGTVIKASKWGERGLTMEPVYQGEPILAVAAVDELTAAEAIEKIKIDFEPLPFVIDPLDTLRPGGPNPRVGGNIWHRPAPPQPKPGERPQGPPPLEVHELKWTPADFEDEKQGRLPMGKIPEDPASSWSHGDVDAALKNAALVLDET